MSYDCKRYTKATSNMLKAREGGATDADYEALDAAHECDRFLSALASAAENIAERAAAYARDIRAEGYVSSMNNPVSTSMTYDMIRNEALFDMAKNNFRRVARRAYGNEGAERLFAIIDAKVSS